MSVQVQPEWYKRPDEKALWYARFEIYRLLGTERSLLAAYNEHRKIEWAKKDKPFERAKSVASTWDEQFLEWEWKARAEAWDEAEREIRRKEYQAERLARRKRRQQLLDKGFAHLDEMLGKLRTDTTVAQFTLLLDALYRHERAEYDDEPATRLALGNRDGESTPIIHITVAPPVPARGDPAVAGDANGDQP